MMNRIQQYCLLTILAFATCSSVYGQGKQIQITKANIPEDALGHVSIRVQAIIQDPMFQLVPWEIITAAGMDNFGFDPTAVDRVEIIFGGVGGPPLKWCAVVSLTDDWNTLQGERIDERKLTDAIGQSGLSLSSTTPREVFVGQPDFLEIVAKAPAKEGELARQVKRIGQSALATAIFVPGPIRQQLLKEADNSGPAGGRGLVKVLITNMQMLALRLELAPKISVPVVVECATPAAAQEFGSAWQQLLTQIFIEGGFGSQGLGKIDTPVKEASVAYEKRFQKEMVRQLTPTLTGNRLLLRLDSKLLQTLQSTSFMPGINAAIVAGDRAR